jgi:hypothetical protein
VYRKEGKVCSMSSTKSGLEEGSAHYNVVLVGDGIL